MARPRALEPTTTLTIKLPVQLRADFVRACQIQDRNASVVLRDAVREYLRQHPLPAAVPTPTAAPAPVEEDI